MKGLGEGRGTISLKSKHLDIEMVACMNSKKHSLMEMGNSKCLSQN